LGNVRRVVRIDASTARQAIRRASEARASLLGMSCAALIAAVRELFATDPSPQLFGINAPMNVRPYFNVNNDSLGYLAVYPMLLLGVAGRGEFGDVARHFQAEYQNWMEVNDYGAQHRGLAQWSRSVPATELLAPLSSRLSQPFFLHKMWVVNLGVL